MEEHVYAASAQGNTVFAEDSGRAWLSRLCGMVCGDDGLDVGPARTQGPAVLSTSLGRFEAGDLALVEAGFGPDGASLTWDAANGALRLHCRWSFDVPTGVWSRTDTLTNYSSAPVTIYRCQARVTFAPARYEAYAQDSRWSNENQGAWLSLHTGDLLLGSEWGRSTQGGTPYVGLRELGADHGVALHILPGGNWSIHLRSHAVQNGLPYLVVELGLADEDLRRVLQPGETLTLPEILIQELPDGLPHLAAERLHRYALGALFGDAKPQAPVVYNTWFYEFEVLDVPRLRRQLAAAAALGCEVFVIDAGWYGPGGSAWYLQTGDWREKTGAAFFGRMAEFADEVRAAGLGFGLWMEPERFGPTAPICQEHPEWFVPAENGFARIDLAAPAAYAYLKSEIARLVETYRLAWMKVDFNFSLGYDASGQELAAYYAAWYHLMDEIRAAYPGTFFEGCSSGGMRSDLHTLAHFDGHFLTDTVNPVDVLRITEGALLRLPPGRMTKWCVLRSIGQTIPRYTLSVADSPVQIATPGGGLWEPAETVDVDFAAQVCLLGMFGLSGDIAGLPPEAAAAVQRHIAFYKQWRRFIVGSTAHPLTPPRPITDRTGWTALQLQHPQLPGSLVFVYRLADARRRRPFVLHGLDPDVTYVVRRVGDQAGLELRCQGHQLMGDGLLAEAPAYNTAAIYEVMPA
jgi:alpha-galactosidase